MKIHKYKKLRQTPKVKYFKDCRHVKSCESVSIAVCNMCQCVGQCHRQERSFIKFISSTGGKAVHYIYCHPIHYSNITSIRILFIHISDISPPNDYPFHSYIRYISTQTIPGQFPGLLRLTVFKLVTLWVPELQQLSIQEHKLQS